MFVVVVVLFVVEVQSTPPSGDGDKVGVFRTERSCWVGVVDDT